MQLQKEKQSRVHDFKSKLSVFKNSAHYASLPSGTAIGKHWQSDKRV
jgi:hypothetical protein